MTKESPDDELLSSEEAPTSLVSNAKALYSEFISHSFYLMFPISTLSY